MTGQMKTMLDRLYPFAKQGNGSKMESGKKAIWVITQRNADGTRYVPVFETLLFPMKFIGFSDCKFLVASGTPSLEALLSQQDKLQEAYSLGGWLVE
jgi:multimeric flavodoxin WrbA